MSYTQQLFEEVEVLEQQLELWLSWQAQYKAADVLGRRVRLEELVGNWIQSNSPHTLTRSDVINRLQMGGIQKVIDGLRRDIKAKNRTRERLLHAQQFAKRVKPFSQGGAWAR
jgi:hypothetical protein